MNGWVKRTWKSLIEEKKQNILDDLIVVVGFFRSLLFVVGCFIKKKKS